MQPVFAASLFFLPLGATGHGFVTTPGSRNHYCGAVTKPDHVLNNPAGADYPVCEEVLLKPDGTLDNRGYQFMSVLTHTRGRKEVSPLPSNVCSFDSETWNGDVTPWDLAIDWPTTSVKKGPQEFVWDISYGPHFSDTDEFVHYITKPDYVFEVGKPLTWDDFEPMPFCELFWDKATGAPKPGSESLKADIANAKFGMECDLPARTGRHVIYAEWGRTPPTLERFHSCIDVEYDGSNNDPEVKAVIKAKKSELSGSGKIKLNGNKSVGKNLKYEWKILTQESNVKNKILKSSKQHAILKYANPRADTQVIVSLTVTDGSGNSHTETTTFVHMSSNPDALRCLGQLWPSMPSLHVDDKIFLRLIDAEGKDYFLPSGGFTIKNTEGNKWMKQFVLAVRSEDKSVRIGKLNKKGKAVLDNKNIENNRLFVERSNVAESGYFEHAPAALCKTEEQNGANDYWVGVKIFTSAPFVTLDFSNSVDLDFDTLVFHPKEESRKGSTVRLKIDGDKSVYPLYVSVSSTPGALSDYEGLPRCREFTQ